MKQNPNMPAVALPPRPEQGQSMPRVVIPSGPSEVQRQVAGDPYARPATEVTVEEWRVLISSVAGPLRVSQGFPRNIPIPAGEVKLVAQNDKSYALFIFAQARVQPAVLVIAGDPRACNPDNGIRVLSFFEQVLLPKEKLYAFSAAGVTLVVTEVTV